MSSVRLSAAVQASMFDTVAAMRQPGLPFRGCHQNLYVIHQRPKNEEYGTNAANKTLVSDARPNNSQIKFGQKIERPLFEKCANLLCILASLNPQNNTPQVEPRLVYHLHFSKEKGLEKASLEGNTKLLYLLCMAGGHGPVWHWESWAQLVASLRGEGFESDEART